MKMMRVDLLTGWMIAATVAGVALGVLWAVGLANGFGVSFEISMLFETLPLSLGFAYLAGFACFGINKAVLRMSGRLKAKK